LEHVSVPRVILLLGEQVSFGPIQGSKTYGKVSVNCCRELIQQAVCIDAGSFYYFVGTGEQ